MPALPQYCILEGLHYGFPVVSKARSTDHSLLVTYDNEQWLIKAEKAAAKAEKKNNHCRCIGYRRKTLLLHNVSLPEC